MRVCDLKHSVTLLRGIKHDNYMDLMFICRGNVKVFAQKLVLLSVSPFLKVLLSHMSCCQHNMFCVSLPDIDPGSLQLVLNFLYEGVMKVRASELEGFSDAMYVLGIEIPQTATASVVETLDPSELPSSRSRAFAPAQRPSQPEVSEPVDPLNVPDYYHDMAVAPLAAVSSTVVVPNYSAMLALNGNPGEAVGQIPTSSRASNSAHSSTTMIIPKEEIFFVISSDIDEIIPEETDYPLGCNDDITCHGKCTKNMSIPHIKIEKIDYDFSGDILPAKGVKSCNQKGKKSAKSRRIKNICLALNKIQEMTSNKLLESTDMSDTGSTRNLRQRNWTQPVSIYEIHNRKRLTKQQYQELEIAFKNNNYLSKEKRKDLATRINMTAHKVDVWFKNRRKKQQKNIFRSKRVSYGTPSNSS
ncbi:uncharacterized protein LOC134533948 isoform X2 [Bacillus rossius redtenbacheri]